MNSYVCTWKRNKKQILFTVGYMYGHRSTDTAVWTQYRTIDWSVSQAVWSAKTGQKTGPLSPVGSGLMKK